MAQQIQLRRGTAAQATSANAVLAAGEVGVETDTHKFKIGDGVTAWNSLAYADPSGAAAALAAHEADTTNIHGIADTSQLETTTGSAAKVAAEAVLRAAADVAAIATAAADATSKANTAQSTAISTASSDATTKANAAQAAAIAASEPVGTVATHIGDTTDAHDASAISVLDTAANYTATDVEGVLAELPSQFAPIAAAWQATTAYKAGQLVYNGTVLYKVDADFTSPGSFNATGLTAIATATAATTSASGIVELATTGETQTGTDAVRAVTPAGAAATYAPIASLVALPLSIADLDTTGTKDATTVLHGDGSWMVDKSVWGIDNSVETMSREQVNSSGVALNSSGRVMFTHFVATRSLLAGNVHLMMGTTPAGATPTLVRIGLYTVASDGQVDLVASTANDTAWLATGSVQMNKALSAAYQIVKGTKYSLGVIVVTGAALPTFCGQAMGSNNLSFVDPIMMAARAGQTDLPSSVTKATFAGGAVNSASRIHAWFTV